MKISANEKCADQQLADVKCNQNYLVILRPWVVSCPARVRLPARNSLVNKVNILWFIPKKCGKDQRDCEIGNYCVELPLQE